MVRGYTFALVQMEQNHGYSVQWFIIEDVTSGWGLPKAGQAQKVNVTITNLILTIYL